MVKHGTAKGAPPSMTELQDALLNAEAALAAVRVLVRAKV